MKFLQALDSRLKDYFASHKNLICCKKGCSACCEKGDYPISEIELRYIMQGYVSLNNEIKCIVQQNIEKFEDGGQCPFLINKECSIYSYRPIICRVHGLAYLCKDNTAKLPFCANNGLNYNEVYKAGSFLKEPIKENLDTQNVLKDFEFGQIRNLYDWLKN